MSENAFKMVINLCIAQFFAVFIFVQFVCHSKTKLHMALVGISAILGLLIGASAYSTYYTLKEERERREKIAKLEEALKKLKAEEEKNKLQNG